MYEMSIKRSRCACMYRYVDIYVCLCTYVYIYVNLCMYEGVHIYRYVYIYIELSRGPRRGRSRGPRGRRRGPRGDGIRGSWDGMRECRGPGWPPDPPPRRPREGPSIESYKHWDGYSWGGREPQPRSIGPTSTIPVGVGAEWGPRRVRVGCKWSQACEGGDLKN